MDFPATWAQTRSFSKHIVSFSMGGISFLMLAHVLTPAGGQEATGAITQITTGVASIVAGITTLVSIAMGVSAAIQQSPLWQMLNGARALNQGAIDPKSVPMATQKAMVAATDKLPEVVNVLTTPEVANSIPSSTVVSTDDARLVEKK